MNDFGRINLFFVFLIFALGHIVFVGAVAPDWVNGASDVNYTVSEDTVYYHNFSANITDFNNDVTFAIDTDTDVNWTNASGTFSVSAVFVSSWLFISDENTGNLTINAIYDNQTGFFVVPIQATNTSGGAIIEDFEFQINATNDAPDFITTVFEHNWSVDSFVNYTVNLSDEEKHYPLNFTLTPINCSYGALTGRVDDVDCGTPFILINNSNSSADIGFNFVEDRVGVYWFNLSVVEATHSCPHAYCDNSTYNLNNVVSHLVRFDVKPSLTINVSNCTGIATEDEQFDCTVNITTSGSADSLNLSSVVFLQSGSAYIGNSSWFYSNNTLGATDFVLSVPISITPTKNKVGNWSVNFTATDGDNTVTSTFGFYINFTENATELDTINNVSIYENVSVLVNATDEDLLVQDPTVKDEDLTFIANWSSSYIAVSESVEDHTKQYVTANISINYDAFLSDFGEGNYSILLNVSDGVNNSDIQIFYVDILNNTLPSWNSTVYQFSSNENDSVYINLTNGYVNDSDGDVLIFHYLNDTQFDSFNLTTEGIVNFTSGDSDVGQHLVTIYADDGKQNVSRVFNFTIFNLYDNPVLYELRGKNATAEYTIVSGFNMTVQEDVYVNFTLEISDDDFLIPDSQVDNGFYNESLTVDVVATNSTGDSVDLFEFVFNSESDLDIFDVQYTGAFVPIYSQVGNYTIFVNITDGNNVSINRTFFLDIISTDDNPILTEFDNVSFTINDIFDLDINATDEEDGNDSAGNLTYNLTFISGVDFINGNETKFNFSSGVFNVNLSSLSGVYLINVTVNDTSGNEDWQLFELRVYGLPSIVAPVGSYLFNWTEGVAIEDVDFNITYSINNTNLTYKFYLDKIVYSNLTAFNYTDLISADSLRNETNYTWTTEHNFALSFTPNYKDETYGMLKNLTLVVYNSNYPELNSSANWNINVSHVNQNVSFRSGVSIPDKGPVSTGVSVNINLSKYFEDADYWDNKYNQMVNFTINTISGTGVVSAYSSENGWIYSLSSSTVVTEILEIVAHEYNSSNVSMGNATSDRFTVEFIAPSTSTTTSGGGGGSTKLKYFSLKLITPQDIIISSDGFIDIPFAIQNNGQTDLRDILLSSYVRFNDVFSDDVKISLGDNSIDSLAIGDSKNFTMRILANTQRAGKYKATIFANVTSPKFSDFADFFIEIKKANESEAEQILIFTEKFVADNPECLELTELLNLAEKAFLRGEYSSSLKLSKEVTQACEDAVKANEQIKYKVEGFVQDNFSYIFLATFGIFFIGFVFYFYKRVRFNKSRMNEYI